MPADEPVLEPIIVSPDAPPRGPPDPFATFKRALDDGVPWFLAALRAASDWTMSDEVFRRRRLHYLIGGEALDLVLVIERLVAAEPGRVDRAELRHLQFAGEPPAGVPEPAFAAALGQLRYKAYLNHFYGITVEEALLHLAELEAAKAGRLDAQSGRDPLLRIYGGSLGELLAAFGQERGSSVGPRFAWHDSKEFTYWLFRYRLRSHVPARVASDTKRALGHLRALRGVGSEDSPDPLRPGARDGLDDAGHPPGPGVIDIGSASAAPAARTTPEA